jgi:glycosyltransferase involved in cell wall biosynthesis
LAENATLAARIAFVDLVFSWPHNGGADVDLFRVVSGLHDRGYPVHLFGLHERGSLERGRFDPKRLPFSATRLDLAPGELSQTRVTRAIRDAVDAWHPDVVFIQHGFTLKPYVIESLAHHRTVGRYYAHELACARDSARFKNGAPCPYDYLRTPDVCRVCAAESQRNAIEHWRLRTWTSDYLAARAYAPGYHARTLESLKTLDAVIVSNEALKQHLDGFHPNVKVFPGGIDLSAGAPKAMPEKSPEDRKIILMAGRAEDPAKGLDVLLAACALLERQRSDFEIWATHFDHTLSRGCFKALGWRDAASIQALYAQSDICVVPSVWDEPFGLVAVEAMAAARPVCASASGGLNEIVRHTETGFLFRRGDAAELAKELDLLLDNYPLRVRMGEAGRRVAEGEYDWQGVIERCYIPLIEGLIQ